MTWRRKITYGKRNAEDQQIQGRKLIGAEKLSMELSWKTSNAGKRMILSSKAQKNEAVKTGGLERTEGNKQKRISQAKRVTLLRLAKYPLILPPKRLKYTYRSNLEERFQKLGIDYKIIMESSNVELSSIYVEMGFGISFATIVADLPELRKRKLAFLPMDPFFKPDYIALVLRKDKTLISYKRAFIKILFEETSF